MSTVSSRTRGKAGSISAQKSGTDRPVGAGRVSSESSSSTEKSRSGTSSKRSSEGLDATPRSIKHRKQPETAYYVEKPEEVWETGELAVAGEEPDERELDENGNLKKVVRLLMGFAIFDPCNKNKMVSLDALDTDDDDREMEAAGYVRAKYQREEGSQDELDDEAELEEEQDLLYVRLSGIIRYYFDFTIPDDPVWIETQYAFYILDGPSNEYAFHFRNFYRPKYIAQRLISSAVAEEEMPWDDFIEDSRGCKDMFGETWVESDLWRAADEIYGALDDLNNGGLHETPIVEHFLNKTSGKGRKKRSGANASKRRMANKVPKSRLAGNPDSAVLKAKNQRPVQITSRIAAIARDYIHSELQVIGPPPRAPDKVALEKQRKERLRQIDQLMTRAGKVDVELRWKAKSKGGSDFLSRVVVDGQEFEVGDVIVIINERHPFWKNDLDSNEEYVVPPDAHVFDYFWFAHVHSLSGEGTAHVQWFEHGVCTFMQETANPQQLFLTWLCDDLDFSDILGKVDFEWKRTVDFVPTPNQFFCWQMFIRTRDSVSTPEIDWANWGTAMQMPPPFNCPVCAYKHEEEDKKRLRKTKDDQGTPNGFSFKGIHYHLHDVVLYEGPEERDKQKPQPAKIGYITGFEKRSKGNDYGRVVCRRFGRIADIDSDIIHKDGKIGKDERHLFVTEEEEKVDINSLIKVVHVPHLDLVEREVEGGLQSWADASPPNHFYVQFMFPTMEPQSWDEHRVLGLYELPACSLCWNKKLQEVKAQEWFEKTMVHMSAIDVFAGGGGYGLGLTLGSRGLLKVTYAIEISPSAARTFKLNSPETVVICQDSGDVAGYWEKLLQGRKVKALFQLYGDQMVEVPPPPEKRSIKCVIAGFPCQPHSGMNMYKKSDDPKSHQYLNALSYVDMFEPDIVFFENVPNFLYYKPGATQVDEHRVTGGLEHGGVKLVFRALHEMGYQVSLALHNAGHYGAPQGRTRMVIVAARMGVPLPQLPELSYAFPDPVRELKLQYPFDTRRCDILPGRTELGSVSHYPVTIGDAISDLPRFNWGLGRGRQEKDGDVQVIECSKSQNFCGIQGKAEYRHRPRTRFQVEARLKPSADIQHYTRCYNPETVNRVLGISLEPGANFKGLNPEDQTWETANQLSYTGRAAFKKKLYGRLGRDDYFPTIVTNMSPTAKQSQVLHPWCKRVYTVRELARSQGFPDWFRLVAHGENVTTMVRHIGNAVPIPLGKALGNELFKSRFEEEQNNNHF